MTDILYSTRVSATGGRRGVIRSEDGVLDLKLAIPKELGGMGGATNPEQLFAGGYAACFENALFRVARQSGHHFADGDVEVVGEIGLSRNEADAFVLHAKLAVTIAGVDQATGQDRRRRKEGYVVARVVGVDRATAETLVRGADAICHYSNAVRGNVDVVKAVTVR